MPITTRLVAIHGGGDWADASADYIDLPTNISMEEIKDAYNEWYKNTYCPHIYDTPHPEFFGLAEYAIRFWGATEADLEVYSDL